MLLTLVAAGIVKLWEPRWQEIERIRAEELEAFDQERDAGHRGATGDGATELGIVARPPGDPDALPARVPPSSMVDVEDGLEMLSRRASTSW